MADRYGPPPPPPGLSDAAVELWRGHLTAYAAALPPIPADVYGEDPTPGEPDARVLTVLAEACRHLDLADRLAAELAALDDIMVTGSMGQTRVHPLVGEVDRARRTVATLLASIKPPADRSRIGSENVARRWARTPRPAATVIPIGEAPVVISARDRLRAVRPAS